MRSNSGFEKISTELWASARSDKVCNLVSTSMLCILFSNILLIKYQNDIKLECLSK